MDTAFASLISSDMLPTIRTIAIITSNRIVTIRALLNWEFISYVLAHEIHAGHDQFFYFSKYGNP